MKKPTRLRLFGAVILLFNLWLIGEFRLRGVLVVLLAFGFAVGYELLVVRPANPRDQPNSEGS